MGLIDVIKKGTFFDILKGMSVTGTYMATGKMTVEYPWEKVQPFPRFRGAQALLTDPETGDTKCVACMLCATVCPSQCIHITGEITPDGRSRPATFDLDLGRCLLCGLCEEVCPVAAIVMTSEYELATFDKREFWLTKERLLANQENAHKEVFARPDSTESATSRRVSAQRAQSLSAGRAGSVGTPAAKAAALPGADTQRALYEAEPARRPRPDVEVSLETAPGEPGALPPGMAEGKRIIKRVGEKWRGALP
jgi:NADH-quinone oxidoreductase subunit I